MKGGREAVPTGVVTFLFTDIEGSTRRWEADAEAMRRALAAHDEVLRSSIESHDGIVFKHTGDGVCAVFASPGHAVDAAVAAQLELEMPVRMGVATGEAEVRGGDYFGTVLNRAARVTAAGHGGQILLDGATAGLLERVGLKAMGPRRLRGIAKSVDIFQVRSVGLRDEFPPLRTLEASPGNLKHPPTSFVGREAEIGELQAVLKTHRLLTLTGVGGVGKTRLAIELASLAAPDFPDGVWVVELATISDSGAVPEAVAAVLGIVQQPGMSLADSIAVAMENRGRLMLFDNCEHVLDAAADLIGAILATSSTVKVVATSREGLGMAEEQLWPVRPLDVLTGAATLFAERAAAVAPAATLTYAAETITEICRRLDGIPLAIELAASRMQSMSATEVRDRLDDRFRLLVGSRRGFERHQTLRHAVQWSYDLLDDAEQSLLKCCSVFNGGFELAGACAVARSDDELTTLDLLDSLVRKSLLIADPSSGRTRFSMLETIRRFAEAQLVATHCAEDARAAHARYFGSREVDVLQLWDSPRQRNAYDWFALELSNLRTAFRWAADNGDLDSAAAIAAYGSLFGSCVEQHEPFGWAEELVPLAVAVDHPRLAELYVYATLCYYTGRMEDAVPYARAAETALDCGGYSEVPFEFETTLGGFYAAQGHPEDWVDLCRKVIERRGGPHTYALSGLTSALTIMNRIEEANEVSWDLRSAAEADGNPARASFAFFAYGIARRYNDPAAAYEALTRALAIARDSGNRQNEAYTALSLAWLAVTQGHVNDALGNLELATRIRYDAGSFSLMDSPLAVLAMALDSIGLYEAAARVSGQAVSPMSQRVYPELGPVVDHLRRVLGEAAFDELAAAGAGMSRAAMAAHGLELIEHARNHVLNAEASS